MKFFEVVKDYCIPGPHNAYRPRLLRGPWLLFFIAVIFVSEGLLVANLVARQSGSAFLAAVLPAEIIALTNGERAQYEVGRLAENPQLDAAAQAKANDMAAQGYFSHVGPGGTTPWQWIMASGYNYQYAGENLAVRFVDSSDVLNAWMASPSHRTNIVKPQYTEIGVGIAQGTYQDEPATFVVQYFAAPFVAASEERGAPPKASAVLGAETGPPSVLQTVQKQLVRAAAEPRAASASALALAAAVLLAALALAFFIHIQIQHHQMLLGGLVVAGLALALLALNATVLTSVPQTPSEAASVALVP